MKQHWKRTNSDGSVERQIFNGSPGRCLPLWELDVDENKRNPVKQNPKHSPIPAPEPKAPEPKPPVKRKRIKKKGRS